MRDEVEEFLRRAAQRRAQAEAKRRGELQQAAQPRTPRPEPISRPPLSTPKLPIEPLVEIIEAEDAGTSDRFSTSVQQNLRGSSEISRHASNLGAEVDLADDKLEARLHQTFDHQIGALKDTTTAAKVIVAGGTAGAFSVTEMLASPQNIRNAIILNEIFARPEHRWE
ncbi:hypothetical protein NA78x_003738 [Anatilimnocola sp. NA78]|uniref:hypothetical protein n=1 Tax=Anatilimnocola sp. NA78 TaxID=3415683 RepID=UPI003CE45AE4